MPYLEAVLVGGWQSGGWGGGEETTRMAGCGCAAWLEEDGERAWARRLIISLLSTAKTKRTRQGSLITHITICTSL